MRLCLRWLELLWKLLLKEEEIEICVTYKETAAKPRPDDEKRKKCRAIE